MIRNPKKFYAILFLAALLALALISASFKIANASIERDITRMQEEMTETWAQFEAQQAARLAEQKQHIKPTVEYKGRLFVEGMHITGEATHYCKCAKCCGKWANITPRKTADGTLLNEIDRTGEKTASCNWLPFNTIVTVDGDQYRVADRGGKGLDEVGVVDIYVPGSHQDALKLGRLRNVDIVIVSLHKDKV